MPRKLKRKKDDEKVDLDTKRARKKIVDQVARELIKIQEDESSKYGDFGSFLKEKQRLFTWLTRNMVTGRKTRIINNEKKKKKEEEEDEAQQQQEPPKKAGRPKGSTDASKLQLAKKEIEFKIELTERYRAARKAAGKTRLAPGTYSKLHDDLLKEMELDGTDISIGYSTIKERIRKNIVAVQPGPISPTAAIEPYIATIALYREDAGQPMTPEELTAFSNSLITGSKVEEEVQRFHSKNGHQPPQLLGNTWYNNFMKRYNHILCVGKGTQQHNARKDWTTFENMQQMYERVYKQMVNAGIARYLPENEHYWVDAKGNKVDSEDKAAGHKVTIKLEHPEWLLFGDEVGNDTAQDQDGASGGELFITGPDGKKVPLRSTKATGRFTVMGLTAATGEPVMCILIIAAKELGVQDYLGFDHQAGAPYDTSKTFQENCGEGKALPGLPKCMFRGKEVPGLVACSPKGSMTSKILKEALKALDDLGVYPRGKGRIPMALFDGHDSRLQVPFLEYINQDDGTGMDNPRWKVCIGLPNGTAKWQVGDSTQQNGCFKMKIYKEKRKLVNYKLRFGFTSIDIKREDIVPLVVRAWEASFARTDKNLCAIMERGWHHLDMRLLKDPEILKTKVTHISRSGSQVSSQPNTQPQVSQEQSTETVDTSSKPVDCCSFVPDDIGPLGLNLNVASGISGTIILDFLQQLRRNAAVQEAVEDRKKKAKETTDRYQHFLEDVKLSAGNLFKSGEVLLGNAVLKLRQERDSAIQESKLQPIRNAIKAYWKHYQKYSKLLESDFLNKKDPSKGDLDIWLRVRKKKTEKLPDDKNEKIALMKDWNHRPPLTVREYLLDQKKDSFLVDRVLAEKPVVPGVPVVDGVDEESPDDTQVIASVPPTADELVLLSENIGQAGCV